MQIYLGGKMSGHRDGDNWRLGIVDGIPWHGSLGGEFMDVDGAVLSAACGEGVPPEEWPVLPKAIFGKHDYVGPYLVRCDHGCFHGGDHATSIEWGHGHDVSSGRSRNRKQITYLCTHAMVLADVLFFWFDRLDAYGTLAELVFASTFFALNERQAERDGMKTTKKHFFVASPDFNAIDEMWLAFRLAGDVTFLSDSSPRKALEVALEMAGGDTTEYSPIEKMFIEKWRTIHGNGIASQFNVPGFRYRVDFAFPDDKIAVELDGYEYHNSKEQFTNDRKRQREMEAAGWRFIRFSGSEVYNNAEACVRQAYEFWQSLTQAKA